MPLGFDRTMYFSFWSHLLTRMAFQSDDADADVQLPRAEARRQVVPMVSSSIDVLAFALYKPFGMHSAD